jgi:hypothetical protein
MDPSWIQLIPSVETHTWRESEEMPVKTVRIERVALLAEERSAYRLSPWPPETTPPWIRTQGLAAQPETETTSTSPKSGPSLSPTSIHGAGQPRVPSDPLKSPELNSSL